MVIFNDTKILNADEDVGIKEHFYTVGGNTN
jgi:hypothetical protein